MFEMSVYRITIPILHCDSCTWLDDGVCGGDGGVGRRCGGVEEMWGRGGDVGACRVDGGSLGEWLLVLRVAWEEANR